MVYWKYYKGLEQMFSKDPEEETTKSFEGQDWEAIDYISIFSLSATMAWWGVRNDE